METYEVPDLQLAAWLVAIGAPFPETARSVRGRAVFVFANTEGQIAWDAEKYRLGCDEAAASTSDIYGVHTTRSRNH